MFSSIPVKHLVDVLFSAIFQFTQLPHVKYTTTLNLIHLYYVKCYTHVKNFLQTRLIVKPHSITSVQTRKRRSQN